MLEQQLQELLRQPLRTFRAVRKLIAGGVIRTPLLPFGPNDREIRLKAECLQPLGSFKIRAASAVVASLTAEQLERGLATASAGNFAQGLALAAGRRGAALTAHVPDHAAAVKVEAIKRLGASIETHSFDEWWRILSTRCTGMLDGHFVHPVCERA